MGASGGFPIDLVLFGMIAAFLVLRLRSILGKRTGLERQAPPVQPSRLVRPPARHRGSGRTAGGAADGAGGGFADRAGAGADAELDRNFDPGRSWPARIRRFA